MSERSHCSLSTHLLHGPALYTVSTRAGQIDPSIEPELVSTFFVYLMQHRANMDLVLKDEKKLQNWDKNSKVNKLHGQEKLCKNIFLEHDHKEPMSSLLFTL